MRTLKRSGQSLVGVLVVLVIIMLGYWFLMRGGNTGSGPVGPHGERTIYKAAINKASGVECMSNLRQIRQAIQMYEQTNEKKPTALADLKSNGVTSAMLICPVTKKPYAYDQATGVRCTDPPHANY